MPNPLDPERRAALRKRAEQSTESWDRGTKQRGRDELDLLAALETAEQAIRDALAAAEAEGIDRYRGTDERREFVRILYGALEGAEPE